MTELSGSLGRDNFPPLLRLLWGLKATGHLYVTHAGWSGELGFDHGRLVAAEAEEARGLPALDFIVLVLSDGQFRYASGPAPETPNVAVEPAELWTHLRELLRSAPVTPVSPLEAVPRLLEACRALDSGEVALERGTLATLLEVDGHRSVREIIGRRRSVEAVAELRWLEEQGLVSFEPAPLPAVDRLPAPASAAAAPPPVPRPTEARPSVPPGPVVVPLPVRPPNVLGRPWLLGYLAGLALAELVVGVVNPEVGLTLHLALLFGLLLHSSVGPSPSRPLLLALALAPLVRVVSLGLPLNDEPALSWYVLTSVPLLVAAAVAARVLGLSRADLRLRLGDLPRQLAIGLLGLPLAGVGYLVLRPAPLVVATLSWPTLAVTAALLLVFAGLVEEFLFRGVLQAAAQSSLGGWGLVYASTVYAVLHIGWLSAPVVIVAFAVGLVFAVAVARTGSLLGVGLAHGLANVLIYLVIPLLGAAQL